MNTVIFGGGLIESNFIKDYLKETDYDYVISVDKGLEFCDEYGIKPDIILGDFDSVCKETLNKYVEKGTLIRQFDPIKDATDMQIAIEHAIEVKSSSIEIFGATGSRVDHMLGSIQTLCIPLMKNIPCTIVDANNKIELINQTKIIEKHNQYGKYVSLIPLTSHVKAITLKGFKYTLTDYDMSLGNSLGISNEIISDIAKIILKDGILVLVQSKD